MVTAKGSDALLVLFDASFAVALNVYVPSPSAVPV